MGRIHWRMATENYCRSVAKMEVWWHLLPSCLGRELKAQLPPTCVSVGCTLSWFITGPKFASLGLTFAPVVCAPTNLIRRSACQLEGEPQEPTALHCAGWRKLGYNHTPRHLWIQVNYVPNFVNPTPMASNPVTGRCVAPWSSLN